MPHGKLTQTNRPRAVSGEANMVNLNLLPAAQHFIPADARANGILILQKNARTKYAGNEVIAFPLYPKQTKLTSSKPWQSYRAMGKR